MRVQPAEELPSRGLVEQVLVDEVAEEAAVSEKVVASRRVHLSPFAASRVISTTCPDGAAVVAAARITCDWSSRHVACVSRTGGCRTVSDRSRAGAGSVVAQLLACWVVSTIVKRPDGKRTER